jgi:hypothetical protein
MASGHKATDARSTYADLNKKNVVKDLVKAYNAHVNDGRGGYFPNKHLKNASPEDLEKLKKTDKEFYKQIKLAINSIDRLVDAIDRNAFDNTKEAQEEESKE